MKPTSIRLKQDSLEMLTELSDRTTTAAQTVIELFTSLRRSTITELSGRFTAPEIRALAEVYKRINPSWQMMASPEVIITTVTNAEKHKSVVSNFGANLDLLVGKLKPLTSAQALILQHQLINFWEHETPDVKTLVKALS